MNTMQILIKLSLYQLRDYFEQFIPNCFDMSYSEILTYVIDNLQDVQIVTKYDCGHYLDMTLTESHINFLDCYVDKYYAQDNVIILYREDE